MAWPFTPHRTYLPRSTPSIKASDLNDYEAYFNHLFNGTRSLKKLTLDGTGDQDSSATPDGQVRVASVAATTAPFEVTGVDSLAANEYALVDQFEGAGGAYIRVYSRWGGGTFATQNARYTGTAGAEWERDVAANSTAISYMVGGWALYSYDSGGASPWADASWGSATATIAATGGASIAGDIVSSAGNVEAQGDPASDQGRLKGLQIVTRAGAKPTAMGGAGIGTGGTITITNGSTDAAGSMTVATGTTAGSAIATITLDKDYPAVPFVVLTPMSSDAVALGFYVQNVTIGVGGHTTFDLLCATPGDSKNCVLAYHIIGVV